MATQMICPVCLREYTCGINGVYDGCDECRGIRRTPTGLIIYSYLNPEADIRRTLRGPQPEEQEGQPS